jgi:hypothetical protein
LRDYEKAIELNDNRAVYRSKLNLDSDEAARQAALARIYSDLGFQQLALVEGWKSVNTDPSNYSAHRFLADSYFVRRRYEIARVSELLQSQLLQPINITPIQPLLAESNLFLISSSGAAAVSFNEFNPIFNRNGATAQVSALAGNNDTFGGEFVLSAIQNKLSWSFGATAFTTDGWRENADQDDRIANAFLQYELSYKTSIQAEFRYRDIDSGDYLQRGFEDNFFPNATIVDKKKNFRIGLRHSFSPSSIVLGNFSYNKREEEQTNFTTVDAAIIGLPPPDLEVSLDFDRDDEAYFAELQHLFRSKYVSTVAGGGYNNIDQRITQFEEAFWPGTDPPTFIGRFGADQKVDIDNYNLYLYSQIYLPWDLTFTVGASGDFYDQEDKLGDDFDYDTDEFNPKLGITWNLIPSATLRGALFRTFRRDLVNDQTIEPTQVAGFNQFFDDTEATTAWNYAGGLDLKMPLNIYAGGEYQYRDLKVPYFDFDFATAGLDVRKTKWDEYLGRAYLFWTPHQWLSLSAEYVYEKIERGEEYSQRFVEVKTHSVPLGINFFHPLGLSCGLKVTYYDQEGDFERVEDASIQSGDDTFWLVDAAITYRFPKRYGFFTLGVNNLFDEDFDWAETDLKNPRIQPERTIFGKITLALP